MMTDGFIPASEREAAYTLAREAAFDSRGYEGAILEVANHAQVADRRIAELEAERDNHAKHVEQVSSLLQERVRIAPADLVEQLAEARSLIDELAEQLIEHSSTNGSAKIPSHHKANTVLAKVEAYRKEQA
jgi:hypothetical protein